MNNEKMILDLKEWVSLVAHRGYEFMPASPGDCRDTRRRITALLNHNFIHWSRPRMLRAIFHQSDVSELQRAFRCVETAELRAIVSMLAISTALGQGWALTPPLLECIAGTMDYAYPEEGGLLCDYAMADYEEVFYLLRTQRCMALYTEMRGQLGITGDDPTAMVRWVHRTLIEVAAPYITVMVEEHHGGLKGSTLTSACRTIESLRSSSVDEWPTWLPSDAGKNQLSPRATAFERAMKHLDSHMPDPKPRTITVSTPALGIRPLFHGGPGRVELGPTSPEGRKETFRTNKGNVYPRPKTGFGRGRRR